MMYADIILQTYDACIAEQSLVVSEERHDGSKDGVRHRRKQR